MTMYNGLNLEGGGGGGGGGSGSLQSSLPTRNSLAIAFSHPPHSLPTCQNFIAV